MKIRAGNDGRLMTAWVAHYVTPATQRKGDTSCVIKNDGMREVNLRAGNEIRLTTGARRVRIVGKGKKAVRRITF